MESSLPTIAGFISTGLFALGTLPMLAKAFRTKSLASYSLVNILLSNVGNIIYALYVFNLPPGPIWFLHSYYLLSTGLMLVWYLRYEGWPHQSRSSGGHSPTRSFSPLCCSPT
jgi:uncharacterized protein with PQ loop repeat